MTFKEIKDQAYLIIDEQYNTRTEAIFTTAINVAYKDILKEKFNASAPILSLNTDVSVLETLKCDSIILSYFAAFYYFKIDGDDEGKGDIWLAMYNDMYSRVTGFAIDSDTATSLNITLEDNNSIDYTVDKVFGVYSDDEDEV